MSSNYPVPLQDILFSLRAQAGLDQVLALPGYEGHDLETIEAVLEEAGRLASGVLSPLNPSGDLEGARLEDGTVRTAAGFGDAYRQFVAGGWTGLAGPQEFGGQGLPILMTAPVSEMWSAANASFALCPMLTEGAMELIDCFGSEEQRQTYLAKLVSGQWTGTMDMTEPQAGSDLGAIRTRAIPSGDHHLIKGQKLYITWGEHDLAENVVHLVLARTGGEELRTRGLSLFIVPRRLPDDQGRPGADNHLRCVSLERKLGIHASPTCLMSYGEEGETRGYLIGEENQGIVCMFLMMNRARLRVGIGAMAAADRAYHQALAYARERVQGRVDGKPALILQHPDVRRQLLDMKAGAEAMRALCYYAVAQADHARQLAGEAAGREAQQRLDLLTPVVKGWCSDLAIELTSTGIQIHGGSGFIEDSGAPQYLRDVRITAIYEGTTGIQAMDLVGRKLIADQGSAARRWLDEMSGDARTAAGRLQDLGKALHQGVEALRASTDWVLAHAAERATVAASSVPYLMQAGFVAGAWLLVRGAGHALATPERIALARCYLTQQLPRAAALGEVVRGGAAAVLDFPEAAL